MGWASCQRCLPGVKESGQSNRSPLWAGICAGWWPETLVACKARGGILRRTSGTVRKGCRGAAETSADFNSPGNLGHPQLEIECTRTSRRSERQGAGLGFEPVRSRYCEISRRQDQPQHDTRRLAALDRSESECMEGTGHPAIHAILEVLDWDSGWRRLCFGESAFGRFAVQQLR